MTTLARTLSLRSAVALIVGQVIAVGIFLTPGTIIRAMGAPAWVLGVWALTGGTAICGALCYGALAARRPDTGGAYVYLREAYGPRVAFVYGWKCFLVMDPGVTAALATGLAGYLAYLVPLGPPGSKLAAIGAIGVLALVHALGVGYGMRLQTWLAGVKLALLAALVVAAFASPAGDWAHVVPVADRPAGAPPLGPALAGALVAAFFSFGGWWEVTRIAGEVRDPGRTLPRALVTGLVLVTLAYVLVTVSFQYVIPADAVAPGEAFVAQVGTTIFGPAGGAIVAAVVVACVLGSLGAILMLAPRVYYAMARDGLFFAAAAAVHPRFGTPARAIAAQALVASVLVALGTFEGIIAYFIFVTVAFVGLTAASVFVIARRDPAFRVPGHPWTAAAFLALVGGLLVLLLLNSPVEALLGAGIAALGVPAYSLIDRPGRREAPAFMEERP